MKGQLSDHPGKIIPFQARPKSGKVPVGDTGHDNIVRLLDLAKYEQPRPTEYDVSMRANIVAMVLLALLVLFATEDFSRLERTNLCIVRSECIY